MMKRLTTVGLLVLFALLLPVSAFAAGEKEQSSSQQQDQVTISIWEHTPQFEAPLKKTLDNFMSENPGINVEYEVKTSDQYYNLLLTALQAGAAPDLFWSHGTKTQYLPNMVEQGHVTDLSGKIDVSEYPEFQVEVGRINDKLYMTPGASVDTRAVYYNKDIFEEYGLSRPESFSDFENIMETLHENGVTPISLGGLSFWGALFHFEPILAAMAPEWLDKAENKEVRLGEEAVRAAMNKMVEWGEKGYYGKDYLGVDEAGQLLAFSSGRSAMTITGSWNAATIKENNPELNAGAFKIPTQDGRRPMVATAASGYSIYSETEHPEASLKLAQYLTTIESQEIFIKELQAVPSLPEIEAANQLVQEIGRHDFTVKSFFEILGEYPTKEDEKPRTIFQEDFQKVLSGKLSPSELLSSMEEGYDYSELNL
jgi:raffinose/stachyose/melibiose transport system substrate-binding protein